MNQDEIDSVVHITCESVVLLCYLIGIGFVLILLKRRKAKVQHLLWLNLSLHVVLLNCLHIFLEIWDFGSHSDFDLLSFILTALQLSLICHLRLAMVLLNIDRLLLILLNMKYSFHVTKNRLNCIILTLWVTCIITFLVVISKSDLRNPDAASNYVFYVYKKYIAILFDTIYTASSVIIFSIIFYRFTMSETKTQVTQSSATMTSRIRDTYKAFRRSRFYFAFLLVLSYTALIFIPHLIRGFKTHEKYLIIYPILVRVSLFVDAVIFMCMNLQVQQLIRESRRWYSSRVGVSAERNIAVTTSTV